MITYNQSNGELRKGSTYLGTGWSGREEGYNNSSMQDKHDIGPIPKGLYHMSPPATDPKLGPYAIRLTPDSGNKMFGRSGFFIHGASIAHPSESSHGCIILPYSLRIDCWEFSEDKNIEVI